MADHPVKRPRDTSRRSEGVPDATNPLAERSFGSGPGDTNRDPGRPDRPLTALRQGGSARRPGNAAQERVFTRALQPSCAGSGWIILSGGDARGGGLDLRIAIALLALALVFSAAVVAAPTASAGHCGVNPGCIVQNVAQCARDALESNPPQFWCEA